MGKLKIEGNLKLMWIEIIGIIATVGILVSMCFKTTSYIGSLWMRIFNSLGSIFFVIYGCLLPAIATAIANALILIVNTYHTYLLIKNHKEEVKKAKEE